MTKHFDIQYYTEDFSVITKPTKTNQLFIILEGSVIIMSEYNDYISAKKSIRISQR